MLLSLQIFYMTISLSRHWSIDLEILYSFSMGFGDGNHYISLMVDFDGMSIRITVIIGCLSMFIFSDS